MLKKAILLVITLLISGCSYLDRLDDVLPDNRSEYKKSVSLPDLEIPPDLITGAALESEAFAIPEEEQATSLATFNKVNSAQETQDSSFTEPTLLEDPKDQWLTTQGTTSSIWPKLREFWLAQGFTVDIDESELGVLETDAKETYIDGVGMQKEKIKIISEQGATDGQLLLLLSSEIEIKSDTEDDSDWVKQDSDQEREKELIAQLNLHLNNSATATATDFSPTQAEVTQTQAELVEISEDTKYLLIPSEFFKTWRDMESTIKAIGLQIEDQDQDKGIYTVLYYPLADSENELSAEEQLAIENNDDPNNNGQAFKISLVGIGNKTEIIVLDDGDNWLNDQDSQHILEALKDEYNNTFG